LTVNKCLIIQTAYIGDVILATPVLEKIHGLFPRAQIDVLLRKGCEGLFHHHPFIGRVWMLDKQNKIKSIFATIKEIRQADYDVVINLHRHLSSGLITLLSNGRSTVGFDKNPLSHFFSKRVPHRFGDHEHPIHEVERNLSLVEFMSDISFVRPKLYPTDLDFKGDSLDQPHICIAPNAVWYTKQWPADQWVSLISEISLIQPGVTIYLLGGKKDVDACERIASAGNGHGVKNMAGRLSFLKSAAYMQTALMNYVNDSGPLHIASAVNAPVAAIFCSTLPEFGFGPLSDRSGVFETNENLDCRPCGLHGRKSCPREHFKCSHIDIQKLAAFSVEPQGAVS
jgi:heptosyltransferase-2